MDWRGSVVVVVDDVSGFVVVVDFQFKGQQPSNLRQKKLLFILVEKVKVGSFCLVLEKMIY